MSTISVTTVQAGPPVPTGVTRASTTIVVTDSANVSQSKSVDGTESPAWTASFDVAAGKGTGAYTDVASDGSSIGSGTFVYDTGTVTPPGQLQTSGVNVTVTSP